MGKYLGQYFLINKGKLREIVEALELKDGDAIIEIGSGHGELTNELEIRNYELKNKNCELGIRVMAIEKDKKFADNLQKKFSKDKNFKIIHGDVLKILPSIIHNSPFIIQNYKVVGNIPFYITGYLLRILGELENKPSLIVLTIQKEVAERICAGKSKMNLLAASVQFWAEPKIIGYISKKDFQPAPEVDSAIIKLNIRKSDFRKLPPSISGKSDFKKINADKYYQFIKILFKQPRKTILNNLEFRIKNSELRAENRQKLKEKLAKIGVNPNTRPQDLSVGQIIELSTLF